MVGHDHMKFQDIIPQDMPVIGPATPNMPSVENSLFEHFVTFVSWCYMIISWCVLKSGIKWGFWHHNMATDCL